MENIEITRLQEELRLERKRFLEEFWCYQAQLSKQAEELIVQDCQLYMLRKQKTALLKEIDILKEKIEEILNNNTGAIK